MCLYFAQRAAEKLQAVFQTAPDTKVAGKVSNKNECGCRRTDDDKDVLNDKPDDGRAGWLGVNLGDGGGDDAVGLLLGVFRRLEIKTAMKLLWK